MRRIVLLVLFSSLLAPAAFPLQPASGHDSSRCASTAIYLANYEGTSLSPYYQAEEGDLLHFTLERHGHICTTATARATYSTPAASAVHPADYAFRQEIVTLAAPAHLGDPTSAPRSTTTAQDEEVESLEQFVVSIDEVEGAGMGFPAQVPALVIDDDGTDRFSFGPSQTTSGESAPAISVPVFRSGPASTQATIDFTVGAPTDSAHSPADYTGTTDGTLTFVEGDRVETISLNVVNDSQAEPQETLSIQLSNAAIEGPSTKTVTIQDNEEHVAPVSRWHHPRQGVDYAYGDYRLREIHVYADDNESLVSKVHFALRKRMGSGSCAWWTSTGFAGGSCSVKRWVRMRVYDADTPTIRGFYFYRLPKLASSVRTTISNYTAYARATDKSGNVETLFKVGRNANTFEVQRP